MYPNQYSGAAEPYRTLLLDCAHLVSAFRRRLSDAGYPFKEPPLCDDLLQRIDRACFADGKPQETKAGAA